MAWGKGVYGTFRKYMDRSNSGTHRSCRAHLAGNWNEGICSIDTEGYDVSQRVEEADLDLYRNAFGTDPMILNEASPINHLFSGTNYPRFFIAKRGTVKKLLTH